MTEKGGYIAISRKLFQHELFTEKREYSRFEAWVDLIQLCAFEDNNSMLFKGRVVKWGRGQAIASVRFLQQRWSWKSVDKVFCFLELLRSQEMIQTDKEQGIGRITLCKYDDYNPKPNKNRNTDRTVAEHRPNNIKEYNKEEIIKAKEGSEPKDETDFIWFWEAYGKKADRSKCEHKFKNLSQAERNSIRIHVPEYVASTPNTQYRKNPLTYLNGKCWNDEIFNPATAKQNKMVY